MTCVLLLFALYNFYSKFFGENLGLRNLRKGPLGPAQPVNSTVHLDQTSTVIEKRPQEKGNRNNGPVTPKSSLHSQNITAQLQ